VKAIPWRILLCGFYVKARAPAIKREAYRFHQSRGRGMEPVLFLHAAQAAGKMTRND
jgi:hypothetical protein